MSDSVIYSCFGKSIKIGLPFSSQHIDLKFWLERFCPGIIEDINYGYFFLSLAVSMVVGVIAASLWPEGDFRIALLAGYAGADFLEGLFKLKFQQKFVEVKE